MEQSFSRAYWTNKWNQLKHFIHVKRYGWNIVWTGNRPNQTINFLKLWLCQTNKSIFINFLYRKLIYKRTNIKLNSQISIKTCTMYSSWDAASGYVEVKKVVCFKQIKKKIHYNKKLIFNEIKISSKGNYKKSFYWLHL